MKKKILLISLSKKEKNILEVIDRIIFEFEKIRLKKIKEIRLSPILFSDYLKEIKTECQFSSLMIDKEINDDIDKLENLNTIIYKTFNNSSDTNFDFKGSKEIIITKKIFKSELKSNFNIEIELDEK